jgi:hypothetical protein
VPWYENPGNNELLGRLRAAVADSGRVLVFLGAGVSFGAARYRGRATFDNEIYRPWPPSDLPQSARSLDDDGLPLPSWPWLVSRMWQQLALRAVEEERESLGKFFHDEGPLDCAQLFRQTVGEANYREFLLSQFATDQTEFIRLTPSHDALVQLDLPLLFTTNYDLLIENAYVQAGKALRVSMSEEQFKAQFAQRPPRHLIKLHGSIDQPETIVLTRRDYAQSRNDRKEMFAHLRSELAESPFLFVGFSLSDPNFTMLYDDIRLVYGMNAPASYTVQGRRDLVKERYLLSLDVNTVWLDQWNDLPNFLRRIDPKVAITSGEG